ncbi:hypothetical protein [Halomicronema sp. CCY15110]|uniref:hypothetical protein n=1 Tax=Halomicronema sp. CCY15110 TaxID=2767773 RepID=UPI001951FF36|nr:hypothetical protein [Halomicronema sp. CCY15110]
MSNQFIVELPKHLETAYKAGEIIITGGVARCADGGQIAAHLEQVAPFAMNFAGSSHPAFMIASTSFQAADLVKGLKDTAKLNQIITLTQQIKRLSTVNLAVSGVTLGVSIIGFAIVVHQINQANQKLDQLNSRIHSVDLKISDLIKNETGKLIADVKLHTKHCITLIHQLEDIGWSDHLDIEIAKQLNHAETLIERIINTKINKNSIGISLELCQHLYHSYAGLLKAYLTSRYLHQRSLDYPAMRLKTLYNFSSQLTSSEILDELYEEFLLNNERRFSGTELDYILSFYKYGCQNTAKNVENQCEILNTVPLDRFLEWRQNIGQSESPLIWLEHSRK